MQFDYFYGSQAEQFSFYRIPKVLFTEPQFMQHSGPWRSVHYLALGGTDYAALDAFLKYFPAVRKIVLCLDNDNAGRTRTQDIIAHLAGSGKAVEDRPPPVGKDYNDTLVQYMQEYRAHCISMDDILEETR